MRRRRRADAALLALTLTAAACAAPTRVGAPCASAPSFTPFDEARPARPRDEEADGILETLVAWYQHRGRAPTMPGVGCPFAPTCSHYARTALRRYGPLAIILIVDRLFIREHAAAAAYYPTTCVTHTTRLTDDVP